MDYRVRLSLKTLWGWGGGEGEGKKQTSQQKTLNSWMQWTWACNSNTQEADLEGSCSRSPSATWTVQNQPGPPKTFINLSTKSPSPASPQMTLEKMPLSKWELSWPRRFRGETAICCQAWQPEFDFWVPSGRREHSYQTSSDFHSYSMVHLCLHTNKRNKDILRYQTTTLNI